MFRIWQSAKAANLFAGGGIRRTKKLTGVTQAKTPEILFEPKEKYIWFWRFKRRKFAVGRARTGKIDRTEGDATPKLPFVRHEETHYFSSNDKQGNLYAGTDGNGFVLRSRRQTVRALDEPCAKYQLPSV